MEAKPSHPLHVEPYRSRSAFVEFGSEIALLAIISAAHSGGEKGSGVMSLSLGEAIEP
jgi:hypothetical protein